METQEYDGEKFRPTGQLTEVTEHQQRFKNTQSNADETYARKSQTHLWLVMVTHKATDQMLDGFDGTPGSGQPILDHETIWMSPAVVCLICEQPYEPRLRLRKCPGDPS